MSDEKSAAGQEGPTPDFIPGWFIPRPGNAETAEREAVRIPDPGDFFPITFLRSSERVSPCQRPRLGFTIGPASQSGHDRFDLAVPPGYWIVRDADGHLHNWTDEDFKAKWVRNNGAEWTPPVERGGDPSLKSSEEPLTATEIVAGGERPAWAGEPPAEGTRRALIRNALAERIKATGPEGEFHDLDGFALALADVVEEALLGIDDEGREADAQAAIAAVGDSLDRIDAPQGATYAERIDRLFSEFRDGRRELVDAGSELDRILGAWAWLFVFLELDFLFWLGVVRALEAVLS